MNNEARNLRLSDSSLFPTKRARLASARQSDHTLTHKYVHAYNIALRFACVRARIHAFADIVRTDADAFVWVARTFRKQSSREKEREGELLAALGDETDASIPETAPIYDEKKAEKLAPASSARTCVCMYVAVVRIIRTYDRRTTRPRHEYLRRYAFSRPARSTRRARCRDGRRPIYLFFRTLNQRARDLIAIVVDRKLEAIRSHFWKMISIDDDNVTR